MALNTFQMPRTNNGENALVRIKGSEFRRNVCIAFVDEHLSCPGRKPLEFVHHAGKQVGVGEQLVDVEVFVIFVLLQEGTK